MAPVPRRRRLASGCSPPPVAHVPTAPAVSASPARSIPPVPWATSGGRTSRGYPPRISAAA
eukprot:4374856-Pyramimonas_sp.AAC.1